jgi:hypothetical protein
LSERWWSKTAPGQSQPTLRSSPIATMQNDATKPTQQNNATLLEV